MLLTLKLNNYIFIDDLEIDFKKGMTVLTGETGSGKSLLMGALNILLGSRSDKSIIQKNKKICEISAIFEYDNKEILVTRKITNNGKSKCYINSRLAPLSIFTETVSNLLDIHGQNTNQGIFNLKEQLNILDHFGGTINLRTKLEDILKDKKKLKNTLQKIIDEKEKLKQQKKILKYQKDELEKLELKVGEYEELEKKYKYFANIDQIKRTAFIANDAAANIQSEITRLMQNIQKIPDYQNYLNEITASENLFNELSRETASFKESLNIEASEIDNIAEKLDKLKRVQKKYNKTNDELIEYYKKISNLLENFNSETKEELELKDKIKMLDKMANKLSTELTKTRKINAKKLEEVINANFKELYMEKVCFKINVTDHTQIQFLIQTNPGQDFAELKKIISGGELSRIMLAIKSVINEFDKMPTLIFDEIDAGIGGKVAYVVGKKLKAISKKHQVICITHLAQVAVFGDDHKVVIKKPMKNHTEIEIHNINDLKKINEIARMLGSEKISETAKKHAEDLIKTTANL